MDSGSGKEIKSNSVYGKQLEHLVTCAKECMEYKKYVVIAGDFNCVQSTVKTYIETLIDPAVLECSFSDPKVTVNKTRAQTIQFHKYQVTNKEDRDYAVVIHFKAE